jgi:hypothetical protein
MSKKQLVVAADVQALAKTGGKVIHLHDPHAIVTAEARSVAKELGVELKQGTDVACACASLQRRSAPRWIRTPCAG